MFYAIIDASSLNNPVILNDFYQKKVTVQYEPESPTSKYHYIFLLEFDEKKVLIEITKFQKEMKFSWYSFFWSQRTLYIVFNAKLFKINLDNDWESQDYKRAQEFGRSQKIPEVYLDFKTHFRPYRKMIK